MPHEKIAVPITTISCPHQIGLCKLCPYTLSLVVLVSCLELRLERGCLNAQQSSHCKGDWAPTTSHNTSRVAKVVWWSLCSPSSLSSSSLVWLLTDGDLVCSRLPTTLSIVEAVLLHLYLVPERDFHEGFK